MKKKLITIVTPCYNEEDNVQELTRRITEVFDKLPNYDFEQIYIDNCSEDSTVDIIKQLAEKNPRVKLIVNSRNFGHIRSPFHGLLQGNGDAIMLMVADLQDPPELIEQFIDKWEQGNQIVVGVKAKSHEMPLMFLIRSFYYALINRLSEIKLVKNFTGFGLYDKCIIDILRGIDDPYPYFRGLIFELGFNVAEIEYVQPKRMRGITKNNFYKLYDIAMLGICSHSKVPLRIATISGFILSFFSFFISMFYLFRKLLFWNEFGIGIAPLISGLFFFMSIILFFIGVIGEYLGILMTKNSSVPRVIEKERVNF